MCVFLSRNKNTDPRITIKYSSTSSLREFLSQTLVRTLYKRFHLLHVYKDFFLFAGNCCQFRIPALTINSFPASGNFCRLLIIFANSLDPDQARQNVGPDLGPNCLALMVFLKDVFEKVHFEKIYRRQKKA